MSEEMKNRPEAGKQAGSCPGDRTADGRQSDAEPELCEDLRQYVTQVNRNIRNAANACQKTIMDTLEDQRVQRFIARHLAPRCGIQGSYYGIAPAPDPNQHPGGPQKDVPAPGFLWSFDTELFPDNPEKTGTVSSRI